jgi:hypothetical protein
MVYNRSPERVDEFKAYAKENEVEEGHYEVVKDLKEIGEKWVLLLKSHSFRAVRPTMIRELLGHE